MGATSDGSGEATGRGLDLSPFLTTIDRAIEVDEYVDYAEAYSYAHGIGEVLDGIERLLEQGHAEGVPLEPGDESLGGAHDDYPHHGDPGKALRGRGRTGRGGGPGSLRRQTVPQDR